MSIKGFINILDDFKIWLCNFIINKIPFHNIRLAYYKKVMKFKIGSMSTIHLGCTFCATGRFEIGENSTINQFCRIDNRGDIYIGNSVSISPFAKIITANHKLKKYSDYTLRNEGKVVIKDYCFIGADAMILQDVVCEKGTVLGAKSLLLKSTVENGIYFGIPAQLKDTRIEDSHYQSHYVRWFH